MIMIFYLKKNKKVETYWWWRWSTNKL